MKTRENEMKKRKFVGWALAAALTITALSALAQQDEGPILHPKSTTVKSAGATLLVICDLSCNWTLDGEAKGSIEAGGSAKAKAEPGQHLIVAMTADGMDQVQQSAKVEARRQSTVSIDLQPVRGARLKVEQNAREKRALEQQEEERRAQEQAAKDQEAKAQKDREQVAREETARKAELLYKGGRYAEAVPLLEESCNSGIMAACQRLGSIYDDGKVVTKDYSRAFALYSKACDAGDAGGCNNLGTMYDVGKGVAKDDTHAVTLYTKACDGGSAEGCFDLGTMYLAGRGVEERDYSIAIKLFSKACDAGIGDGCLYLGSMYGYGYGVTEDPSMALTLEIKACDTNSACGCELAGVKYKMGKSIQKDKAKSQQFFSKERSLGGCTYETLLKIYF